jgi:hypothetical protein
MPKLYYVLEWLADGVFPPSGERLCGCCLDQRLLGVSIARFLLLRPIDASCFLALLSLY